VREAVFSMLAQVLPGSAFLDLYAGSGSVGLEALSRGAARVTWVEQDARSVAALKANLALLAPGPPCKVTRMEVAHWVRGAGRGGGFDVAFADPPYEAAQGKGFFEGLMAALAENSVVAEDGFFVAEMAAGTRAAETPGWSLLRDRTYGHTRIALYRRGGS